jgi:hypothetical protein
MLILVEGGVLNSRCVVLCCLRRTRWPAIQSLLAKLVDPDSVTYTDPPVYPTTIPYGQPLGESTRDFES